MGNAGSRSKRSPSRSGRSRSTISPNTASAAKRSLWKGEAAKTSATVALAATTTVSKRQPVYAHQSDFDLSCVLLLAPPAPALKWPPTSYFALRLQHGHQPLAPASALRATPLAIARCLPGHVLRWHKLGRDGSGKCDASAAGASRKDAVWGVLFAIDHADKPGLDAAEGLGIGYDERMVHVETVAGRRCALTYQARPDRIDPRLRPRAWYKAYVLAGAREHGLPAAYVARLAAVPAEAGDVE